MKYTLAWSNISTQNISLKIALVTLSAVSMTLAVSTARLAYRKPLIIERLGERLGERMGEKSGDHSNSDNPGLNRLCSSRVVESASGPHTPAEMEAFVWEALHERFDSDATVRLSFLSEHEQNARDGEQKELSTRNMTQTLIIRHIQANGNEIHIDADRLIAVGNIRSAFPFPLTATVGSIARTESNPYGLQLTLAISPPTQGGTGGQKQ